MTDIEIHTRHFKKQMELLYGTKKEFRIPENYFDFINLQKQTFTFLGYQTIFGYANGIIYYTKAEPLIAESHRCRYSGMDLPEDPRWNQVIKKIEQYAITGRI